MSYDIIIIGGGIAGSTLAANLAKDGQKVLVLERETQFRDRVRGENMLPWGVATAKRLGILKTLEEAGGHHAPWWITYLGGNPVDRRDLSQTTPHAPLGVLNIYHPALQEAVLQQAIRCGAEVRRGATVTAVLNEANHTPNVIFLENDQSHMATARLVVGTDGRNSQVRTWCGFQSHRNPDHLMLAGTLWENCRVPEEATHLAMVQDYGVLMAPQGKGRVRTYCVYPSSLGHRQLTGEKQKAEFLRLARATGIPEEWFAEAQSSGPLAEFSGADHWVDHPVKNNVALIGDAAASTDPSWGCGLSLSLTDVETLVNALRSNQDWHQALEQYAAQHNHYYSTLRRILGWMTELFWSIGPEADARREKVMPRLFKDPTGFPDSIGQGPFGPSDENARRLILGLD